MQDQFAAYLILVRTKATAIQNILTALLDCNLIKPHYQKKVISMDQSIQAAYNSIPEDFTDIMRNQLLYHSEIIQEASIVPLDILHREFSESSEFHKGNPRFV